MATSLVKTDKQLGFLAALKSPEIREVPARQRFRWAATQAGYSESTLMKDITQGIQAEITEVAEQLLMEASVEAAFVLIDTLDGENIDAIKTKYKVDAAKEILDRAVPKREQKVAQQAPLVQILLPAKQPIEVKVIDG